jgi:hypothetical protein
MVPQDLPKVASMSPVPVQYIATVASWHIYYDLHVSALLSHLQGDTKRDNFLPYLVPP